MSTVTAKSLIYRYSTPFPNLGCIEHRCDHLRLCERILVLEVFLERLSYVKTTSSLLVTAIGLLASISPLLAHHSFAAEYDPSKKVTLKGVVTKFEWTNPHSHIYLDVKGADGKVANWNLELASPNMMQRNGWTRHSVQEGDEVTITADPDAK